MGTGIAQAVIKMFEPKFSLQFSRGVCSLSPSLLVFLACDRAGSRVLDAALASPNALPKVKQRLVDALSGNFTILGCDTYGSYVAQRCYASANLVRKRKIAQELVDNERKLMASRSGSILLSKCRVDKFKRQQTEWETELTQQQRKLELFADFLDDNDNAEKKSRDGKGTTNANARSRVGNAKTDTQEAEKRAAELGGGAVDTIFEQLSGFGSEKHDAKTSAEIAPSKKRKRKSDEQNGDDDADAAERRLERAMEIESLFREAQTAGAASKNNEKKKKKKEKKKKRKGEKKGRSGKRENKDGVATATQKKGRKEKLGEKTDKDETIGSATKKKKKKTMKSKSSEDERPKKKRKKKGETK
eukprot:CAMPEP_0184482722 /NCGR_PEP_ID=MMETSP0113_2-20130426/4300_1 /TAXON_ID=91329 /ORGANISM="Norrisiella sphaerica, Strain BC52" /LENGTH=358 /DNA_ID=CAMNT_0026862629 /DNA_START=21 /DNA_END=1097 /DNA_ORIENTATION=-